MLSDVILDACIDVESELRRVVGQGGEPYTMAELNEVSAALMLLRAMGRRIGASPGDLVGEAELKTLKKWGGMFTEADKTHDSEEWAEHERLRNFHHPEG